MTRPQINSEEITTDEFIHLLEDSVERTKSAAPHTAMILQIAADKLRLQQMKIEQLSDNRGFFVVPSEFNSKKVLSARLREIEE